MSTGVNAWTCQKCGQHTVVVHRDDGVTPFMLGCRATPGCDGMGVSMFYRVPLGLEPTHEWYKPGAAELRTMSPAMRDHIRRGGVAIREIVPDGRSAREGEGK